MRANLKTTIALNAEAGGTQTTGTSVQDREVNDIANGPQVRDIARKRLIRMTPNVDAQKDSQTDSSGFIGKKYRVQDTKYGHYTSEHDNESSAQLASTTRPYSRVLTQPEPHNIQKVRNKSIKKAAKVNPDVL